MSLDSDFLMSFLVGGSTTPSNPLHTKKKKLQKEIKHFNFFKTNLSLF